MSKLYEKGGAQPGAGGAEQPNGAEPKEGGEMPKHDEL